MYSQDQVAAFEKAFNKVCSAHDWKARIQSCIPEADFEVVKEAVAFYTATELRITYRLANGMVDVYADGYRLGPAGDH